MGATIMPFFFLLFAAFFVFVVISIIRGHIKNRERLEALTKMSARRDLRFTTEADYEMENRFPEFQCLQDGDDRYAYNILHGEWSGRNFIGFDYHYETTSTDSDGDETTHNHYFSAVIVECDVPMKPLTIGEESIFDRFWNFFGFDDIDFESAEFSDQFKVHAEDRRWAFDVLHARTMEFLLHSPRFSLAFSRTHCIAWRGSTFEVAEYEAAVDVVAGILDRMPDYVRQQQLELRS